MIDLRRCGVESILDGPALGAGLVHADPPWSYRSAGVPRGGPNNNGGNVAVHYDSLTDPDIAAHIRHAASHARPDAYMLLWCTWPKLAEWMGQDVTPWRYITGGSWHKTGMCSGIGYHVRGNSEPWLLYALGKPRPVTRDLSNAVTSPRQEHSEKPAAWLETMIRALCPEDGAVFDLYAGLGPCAVAARDAGRSYVGAEIDPERHAQALRRLSQGTLWGPRC
jgi:N6-adenosine-specific RNA methylase IME4